jgi:hypothetical protein
MPRIHTVAADGTITASDKLIGSDGAENANFVTRNYTVGSLQTHILTTGVDGSFSGNLTVGGNISVTGNAAIDGNINLIDNARIRLGNDADLQLYHDPLSNTPNSWIRDVGGGDLYLDTNGTQIALISDGTVNNGKMGLFKKDGAVELYYDNNLKFETTNQGTNTIGISKVGNIVLNSTNNEISGVADIYVQKIYDSNDSNYFLDPTAGISLKVKGNIQLGDSAAETNAEITSYGDLILKADIDADGGQCLTTYKTRFNQAGGTDISFNVNQSGWCGGTFARSAFNNIQVGDVVHGLNPVGPSGQADGAASRAITQIIGFKDINGNIVSAENAVEFDVRTGGPVYYDASQSLTVLGSGVAFDRSGSKNIKFFSGASQIASIDKDGKLTVGAIRMVVPTFANDSAAGSGGLVAGDVYKTSAGDLKIKL